MKYIASLKISSDLLALLAGGLVTLSLTPWDIWPAAVLSCGIYVGLLQTCSARRSAWLGWLYGLGLFGTGASWVYVSIHEHGHASVPLSVFLTALFCSGLALLHSLFAWVYVRVLRGMRGDVVLGFPALWVLFEWLRSWLLTGFPWLYIGYAALDTWGEGWVPVTGVFGASLLLTFSGSCLYLAYMACVGRNLPTGLNSVNAKRNLLTDLLACIRRNRQASLVCAVLVALWGIGGLLTHVKWVAPSSEDSLSVGIVQANISQQLKWRRDHYRPTLKLYRNMTQPLLGKDIVLWPEAAIPNYFQRTQSFFVPLSAQAAEHGTALVTGIPWRVVEVDSRNKGRDKIGSEDTNEGASGPIYYNSIVALGKGSGVYHKQRLVPFGEFMPLESWLRGLIYFFDLPMSAFSAGKPNQSPLTIHDHHLSPFICYEIVYPDLVRQYAPDTDLMVTISNDSWFGDSIGPLQHLQMARMRALENGRYLVRGTNDGISAIIDERGKIVKQTLRFQRVTLTGEVWPMRGQTIFSRLGSAPVLVLCLILVTGVVLVALRGRHQ